MSRSIVAIAVTIAGIGCALAQDAATSKSKCFTDAPDAPSTEIGSTGYLLGIDRLLEPVAVRFFPDGLVCGQGGSMGNIRIEGSNISEGQLQLRLLEVPPLSAEEKTDNRQQEFLRRFFSQNLVGSATRRLTPETIIWEGTVQGASGRQFDFYLKRTRPTVQKAAAATKESCGDGGCDPLSFVVKVKKGFEATLLRDAKNMPISKIKPAKVCFELGEPKNNEMCFEGNAWPFEEPNVVETLKRKPYTIEARRKGGDAGVDAESIFLDSDKLLAKNLRINIPVAVPLFHNAIAQFFSGTELEVREPISRQNSLFWEFKGRRYQFEKKRNPSPAERSEWWKVRLQIAVTEKNAGEYVLLIVLPETRITSWAASTVPNDEKFSQGELTNDERFIDLQGRLITALTKELPASKALP